MTKCLGCGVNIQNTDLNKIGYTSNLDNKFCERCFRIKNYNDYIKVDVKNNFNDDKFTIKSAKGNFITLSIINRSLEAV